MGKKDREEKRKKASSQWDPVTVRLVFAFFAIMVPIFAMLVMRKRVEPTEVFSSAPVHYKAHPDHRPQTCPRAVAATCKRDSVSIIIPYLNEEWFRIEATMESIIKYTDLSLVSEIMWISDGSPPDKVFASELKAMHPKVTVQENEVNLGLIVTKMNAAANAKGSILLFLEPHILVTPGWLPPLVNRIEEDPQVLIMPALDVLDEEMNYVMATPGHWRFEWNLNIVFTNPLRLQTASNQPFMSPATSGGIYAIHKDFWNKLDLFDPELIRWGGDHVEASHKVWRCGGRIEIHPCSRIAHWFRFESNRPYDVKVESVVRNYKRLAEVWFDDFISSFYKVKPDAVGMDIGDVTQMRGNRDKLQCKSMEWYVNHVDLELGWEKDRICIPHAPRSLEGCGEGVPAAERMSSVSHTIPVGEYKRRMKTAEAFRKGA